jgi:hypothetical protein
VWKVRGKARGSRWILPGFWTSVARGVIAGVLLLFAGIGVAMGSERDEIFSAVQAYTRAVYARDYAEAYRWIAAVDRELKPLVDYEQDNEAFQGPSLALAQRLAQEIVIRDAVVEPDAKRAKVRAKVSLPHGNAEEVSRLLFAEGGIAEAPLEELSERIAKLEALIASGGLPRVDGEETWTVVREPEGWRVFLDWASGVRIHFATQVAKGLDVTAAFDRTEVLTPRGETVQLRLLVRNHSTAPVQLKAVHRVEPTAIEQQLDLVQCGYLFPRIVEQEGVDESPLVYFVDGELPKDVTQLNVTLEFRRVE